MTKAGDVAVITGATEGNEVSGAVTWYENFQGERLSRRYGPASGKLQKKPGFFAGHDSRVWARDFVVEAKFAKPQGSDWDHGFVIRNPEYNRLDLVGVTGDKWWFHYTRDVGETNYTMKDSGFLSGVSATLLNENRLLLIAYGESGWFFVNDALVAMLDLSHNQEHGKVTVMGDSFRDHHSSPSFEGFNVWAP